MAAGRTFNVGLTIDGDYKGNLSALTKDLQDAVKGSEEAQKRFAAVTGEKIQTRITVIYDADGTPLETSLRKTTATIEAARKAQEKANKTQDDSITRLRQQVNEAKQARDALTKYNVELTKTGRQLFILNSQWQEADLKVKALTRSLNQQSASFITLFGSQIKLPDFSSLLSLGNKITQIGAAIGVVVGAFIALNAAIQPFVQRAIQVEGIRLALTSFGLTAEEANKTLTTAVNLSLSYGASLAQVERAYKRLTPVILASGGSLAETDQIIASITARTTALGLNTEQTNRFIEAFAQVMGKGKLQAEELNQQFSELDGSLRSQLASYLETTYGITDLEAAMKNNAITADIFREFIIEASKALRDQLAGSADFAQARILGLNQTFNPQQIRNYIDTLNQSSLAGFGAIFGEAARIVASLEAQFAQLFNLVATRLPVIGTIMSKAGSILTTLILVPVQAIVAIIAVLLILSEKTAQAIVDAFNRTGAAAKFFINQLPGGKFALELLTQAVGAFASTSQNAFGLAQEQLTNYVLGTRESTEAAYKQAIAENDLAKARRIQLSEAGRLFEQLKNQQESLKIQYEQEVQRIKDKYEEEKRLIGDTKTAAQAAHQARMQEIDDEKSRLREIRDLVNERYDREIEALNQRTPAEERLYQLKKQNLQAEIASGKLSGEALLEAQARLERMQAQEEILGLQTQKKLEQKKIDDATKALDAQKLEDQRAFQQEQDTMKKKEQELQREYEDSLELRKRQFEAFEQTIKESEKLLKALQNGTPATKEATTAQQTYNTQLETGAAQAKNLYEWLKKASDLPAPKAGLPPLYTGGPTVAGGRYTVNELGREAFLSASGRLSMINAPAYGAWRAPSAGTVIPAHLTRLLDIPAGGINLNSVPKVGAPSRRNPFRRTDTLGLGVQLALNSLSVTQQAQAKELGKLSRAIQAFTDKEIKAEVNINGNNPLLNRLRRR